MITLAKKILSSKYKRSVKERLGVPSMHWSLQNLKQMGFDPAFVLDIGAYEGYWTRNFLEKFPTSKVLMFEAQKSKGAKLQQLCAQLSNISFHIALLSNEDGKVLIHHLYLKS